MTKLRAFLARLIPHITVLASILIIGGGTLALFAALAPVYQKPVFYDQFKLPEFAYKTVQEDEINLALEVELNELADIAPLFDSIEPAAPAGGPAIPAAIEAPQPERRFPIEDRVLQTEAVLVPQQKTVISSSRDGKIEKIHVDHGDQFRKGDVLVEYQCADLRAEIAIAETEKSVAQKELNTTMRLLKLDLISEMEKEKALAEKQKADARSQIADSRLEQCVIRADYDGRVVKRLANAGEFTRTDRVLLEVASLETMDAEFLIPSRWLRWVNVAAPFTITLNETGRSYDGEITRIFGEIDPISQSIQIRGKLDSYQDRLLPGMSGLLRIDADDLEMAGITGYLEIKRE